MNLVGLERQAHQRDTHLVVHARVHDGLTGLYQVVYIVHVVEVAIPGGAVLFHQLGLLLQRLEALGSERDSGHRASQDLQIHVGAHGLAHFVLAPERVFPDVHVRGLIAGPAPELEVSDTGGSRSFHGREDVLQANLAAEAALQSIPKGREHNPDRLGRARENHVTSSIRETWAPV